MLLRAAHYASALGSAMRVTLPDMSAVLHVYDPDSSTQLSSYLDRRRCDLAATFDEAPKLAHSIAIDLDDALDSADLDDGSIGTTFIISEADDLGVGEACLSVLGHPDGAIMEMRDFADHRLVGFCCSPDADLEGSMRLINGELVAGFQSMTVSQPLLDATAILANELDEHFELTVVADRNPKVAVYGGRAADGCIVGVLGIAGSA